MIQDFSLSIEWARCILNKCIMFRLRSAFRFRGIVRGLERVSNSGAAAKREEGGRERQGGVMYGGRGRKGGRAREGRTEGMET